MFPQTNSPVSKRGSVSRNKLDLSVSISTVPVTGTGLSQEKKKEHAGKKSFKCNQKSATTDCDVVKKGQKYLDKIPGVFEYLVSLISQLKQGRSRLLIFADLKPVNLLQKTGRLFYGSFAKSDTL